MQTTFFRFFFFIFIFIFSSVTHAEVDPAKLIKVTADNKESCVEYYQYKNEMYCSTTAESTEPVDPALIQEEKLKINFDGRPWKFAWGKKSNDQVMIEYIPAGEKIESWNELVTSQFFPGLQEKATPEKFADFLIEQLKGLGFDLHVTMLEKNPNQVIFEFQVKSPKSNQQDELQMITSDDRGIYVLHYVIKKSDMGKNRREEWIKILKDAKIKS